MRIKDHKYVFLIVLTVVFFTLLASTIVFFLYRQINPFGFPYLEENLLWATTIIGVALLSLYFLDLIQFSIPRISKNKYQKIEIGKFFENIDTKIATLIALSTITLIILIISLTDLAPFFLIIYFFIILGYANSELPLVTALFLLLSCPIFLAQGLTIYANRVALYAYYLLIMAVGLSVVEYLQKNPENKTE